MSISFIIPAYNAANYLERCIKSIVAVKKIEYEIIVINDGSLDNTDDVMKKMCLIYPMIKYITQSNSGVASSRNKGLELAEKDYIVFVDADDEINPEFYELHCERLFDSDIVAFGYMQCSEDTMKYIPTLVSDSNDDNIFKRLYINCMLDYPFAKNYHSSIYGGKIYQYIYLKRLLLDHNIRFKVGMAYAEDLIFCLEAINASRKFKCIDYSGYQYYVIENTASRRFRQQYWNECLRILSEIDHIQKKSKLYDERTYSEKKARIEIAFIKRSIEHYVRYGLKNFNIARKKVKEILEMIEIDSLIDKSNYRNWTLREKIEIFLMRNRKYNILLCLYLEAQVQRSLAKRFRKGEKEY